MPALLAPDFEWPDLELPIHGAAFFVAASDELSAATASVCGASTDAVNPASRTVHIAAESLAPKRQPVELSGS
jgi:hypothetical protein